LFTFVGNVFVKGNHFGADKATLKVGMNDTRSLWCG